MRTVGITGMYLAAIVAANLLIATYGPQLAIVVAFVFIGLDITGRDALHEAWRGKGLRWKMALLIATGSILSYLLNQNSGQIAFASFVAFAAAGLADTALYTLLHDKPWYIKVNGSNLASAAVDSLIFPVIAFGAVLPAIMLGQFMAKVVGGLLWSIILRSTK